MKRSSKASRQIKRNITGLMERQKPERPGTAADAAFHVMAAFVAVLLPLSLVAVSGNIAFRLLDLIAFEEEIYKATIRGVFESALFPSLGTLALSLILFAACRAAERRRYLRVAMNISMAIYICAVCLTLALALYPPFREAAFAWQQTPAPPVSPAPPAPGGESAQPVALGGYYPVIAASAVCLVSFIIYITLYSVLKRLTVEEEKMFA